MPALVADGLRFGSRVGSELVRLGWGALRPVASNVPSTLDQVDAQWVEGVLRVRFPKARVSEICTLGGSSGTTDRRRIEIVYRSPVAGAPSSLFIKLRPRGLVERVFGNVFALGATEVGFYRDVWPTVSTLAPSCFSATTGPAGGFSLVLEDIEARGAWFPTLTDPMSPTRAEAVVSALASLHAAYWRRDSVARFAWLRTRGDDANAAVERFVCRAAHRPTMRRFPHLLPFAVRQGAIRIHAMRPALERYWAREPLTLIHGDPHAGNTYFLEDRAGLFDWQVVQRNQGIRDIAYFLVLSLDTEVRRSRERELVRLYLETLGEHGVPSADLSFDITWERYRSFSLYTYMGASVASAMTDLQPAHITQLGLRRAANAVDDLDALRLLERLR